MSSDLYQQAILDLARRGREVGRLDAPDRAVTVDNPLCGDRVTIDLRLRDGTIVAIGHRVRGCLLCEAAASVIAAAAPGLDRGAIGRVAEDLGVALKSAPERLGETWPELATFAPVHPHKSRHACVLLPFGALLKALDQA